jgi:hypothetical protein
MCVVAESCGCAVTDGGAVVLRTRMNLLIAIMGDSYEKVKESERVQALRERAQIIVEAERTYPSWHKYHRYMHIAEAADISSDAQRSLEWEGITGRVKQLLEMQSAEAKAETAAVKAETAEIIEAKTAEVKAELAEVKALLAAVLDRTR